MKRFHIILKTVVIAVFAFTIFGCVHDDEYGVPSGAAEYGCWDPLKENKMTLLSLAEIKALFKNNTAYVFPDTSKAYIQGWVSSTDASGNIYKTIFIQDNPENPSQGFTLSVNTLNNYGQYPQGSKIYVKLAGLAVGTYGGVPQLGVRDAAAEKVGTYAVSRVPENIVPKAIFRSCIEAKRKITPKVMTLAEVKANGTDLVGCLVQINGAEFAANTLCTSYGLDGITVNKQLNDATSNTTTVVVRNSGYASFAPQTLPSGNGTFVGILSKYTTSSTTWQFYINRAEDLYMTGSRMDKLVPKCTFAPSTAKQKTIKLIKDSVFTGANTLISEDFYLKAKVTANDETSNLYRYIYVQDETGGIRINTGITESMYLDPRFQVGRELLINLKGLSIGKYNGEFQIGYPSGTGIGFITAADVYKYFFKTDAPKKAVAPAEMAIDQLTFEDVGKWITIKNVQFAETELYSNYSGSRTLEDCAGNQIIVRTNSAASFAPNMIDGGKGDIQAILSYFNGTYQLIIPFQYNADFDAPRCDGTVPPGIFFNETLLTQGSFDKFTAYSVAGDQVWTFSSQYGAMISGFANNASHANEDWFISPAIDLSGKKEAIVMFDHARGPAGSINVGVQEGWYKVFISNNYNSGDPNSATWTELTGVDHGTAAWQFVSSGKLSVPAANMAGNFRIAFKYVCSNSASATWEVKNVKVLAN